MILSPFGHGLNRHGPNTGLFSLVVWRLLPKFDEEIDRDLGYQCFKCLGRHLKAEMKACGVSRGGPNVTMSECGGLAEVDPSWRKADGTLQLGAPTFGDDQESL